MEQLTDLKAILHSKRANTYYLEPCRVMQKDGRVLLNRPGFFGGEFSGYGLSNTAVVPWF